LPLILQLAIFATVGLLVYLGIYYGVPLLLKRNIPLIIAFFFFLWLPIIPLLPTSMLFFALFKDGEMSIVSIMQRFRLVPIQPRDWLWVAGAVLVTAVADEALKPVGQYLARKRFFAPPDFLPAPFHPLKEFAMPPQEFLGAPLRGNWTLLLVFIPLHLLAMFSEEMMWRGYLLPLQEAMFGNWAWVLNGILWAWLVHALLKWHVIGMLPGMLAAPFIAQHTQSTWASLLAHGVPNALLWVVLLLGVLGVGANAPDGEPPGQDSLR
jgi:membrane protease YdiL (CAAX protease family)